MEFKDCNLAIKDIDTKQGIVKGYFASFNTLDADNDIFVKGAFKKSIQENGVNGTNRIKYLKQHDVNQPVGKLLSLTEDDNGLLFEAQISKTQIGQDTLLMYEEGIYNEHSVGFSYIPDKMKSEQGKTYLLEVKLFEGSVVLWGANQYTPLVDLKSEYETLATLQKLEKALKIGQLSDSSLKRFENIYSILKSQFEHSDAQKALREKQLEDERLLLEKMNGLIFKLQ